MIYRKETTSSLLPLLFVLVMTSVALAISSPRVVKGASESLTVSPSTIDSKEERSPESKSFTVELSSTPPEDVTVVGTADGDCKVDSDYEGTDGTQSYETSDDFLFSKGQTYGTSGSVKAVDDQKVEGSHKCIVEFTSSSTSSDFDGLNATLTVNLTDNDAAVHKISVSNKSGSLAESKENQAASYEIRLADEPKEEVTVTAKSNGECLLSLTTSSGGLSHNAQKIGEPSKTKGVVKRDESPSTLYVTPVDDSSAEGKHSCKITHSVSTSDPDYSGISVPSISFSIKDNDTTNASQDTSVSNPAPTNSDSNSQDDSNSNQTVDGDSLLDKKDANNDGRNDSKQPHVASFTNKVTKAQTAIFTSQRDDSSGGKCDKIKDASAQEVSSNNQDESYQYPFGVYSFKAECSQQGASTVVNILLHNDFSNRSLTLRKLLNGQFFTVKDASFEQFETQHGTVTKVSYPVTDGGKLDSDQKTNGVIVDPVGPAEIISQAETGTTEQDSQEPDNANSAVWWLVLLLTVGIAGGGGWYYYQKHPELQSKLAHIKNKFGDKL